MESIRYEAHRKKSNSFGTALRSAQFPLLAVSAVSWLRPPRILYYKVPIVVSDPRRLELGRCEDGPVTW